MNLKKKRPLRVQYVNNYSLCVDNRDILIKTKTKSFVVNIDIKNTDEINQGKFTLTLTEAGRRKKKKIHA